MALFISAKREKELLAKIDDLEKRMSPDEKQIIELKKQIEDLNNTIEDEERRLQRIRDDIKEFSNQRNVLQMTIDRKSKELFYVEQEILVQEYGIYKPTYVFANSDLYKDKLKSIRERQKYLVKSNLACTGTTDWTVNGNVAKGRQMVKDTQKLLLRAFNSECDDIVSHVKISNYEKSLDNIKKLSDQISKLGRIMQISITSEYLNAKREELALALDFEQKKQEEKELIKEERERQREEAKVQKEIEEARKKLQKEQVHYKNALKSVEEQLLKNPDDVDLIKKKQEIESVISDTEKAIADVDYREANKKAGYVYVISNIGAFGENVYKIGMTRRLDPMDRINELGDASVPFNFDVHAKIFTDDAPGLEAALHKAFEDKKLNKINPRREFFRVNLDEIKKVVRDNFDKTVEWVDFPEAEQYRQSLKM